MKKLLGIAYVALALGSVLAQTSASPHQARLTFLENTALADPATSVKSPNPVGPSVGASNAPPPADILRKFQDQAAQMKMRQDQEKLLWQSPLLYYGKVIDESNQPISGVIVSYIASAMNDAGEEVYNTGTVASDDRGMFKVDNVNGIGLMLQLSHPRYYPYAENSTGINKRSVPKIGYFPDTEDHAELFRMHSKGHPIALVHRTAGLDVPLSNAATAIDLRGADYNHKIGQLLVEASGNPPQRYDQQPFDWDVKITVPGGGLYESTNEFAFVAPESGYQSPIELAFPKGTPGWTDTVAKSYFVKLPTGFARINVHIGAKRPLFVSLDYYYNPDNSTNLEPDK